MEFKCANCLQLGRDPKLLSCFHVFCSKCLSEKVVDFSIDCFICGMKTFLPDGQVLNLPTVENSYCLEHGSRSLKYYCATCQKVICDICKSTCHKQHSHHEIDQVLSYHMKELNATLKPLGDKLLEVRKAILNLESCEEKLVTRGEAIEKDLATMMNTIQDLLQVRKGKLLGCLHATVQEKCVNVKSQMSELAVVQAQLSSSLGFIKETLRSSGGQEVLMMKNTLLKQVSILLKESERVCSTASGDTLTMSLIASPQVLVNTCMEFEEIDTKSHELVTHQIMPNNQHQVKLLMQRLKTPILILSGLKGPCGVAVRGNGEVVVAEGCGDCVSIYNPSGEKLRSFGEFGTGLGKLNCPCEVAIDHEDHILVVDGSNHRIQMFSADGKFLTSVGSRGSGVLQFTEPDGIAINPVNKKIYVVSNNTHSIHILNQDLSFCNMFGKRGRNRGYLNYPWGVACSCNGEVYVTDSGNCRVQVFTPSGRFLREFGQKGKGPSEFRWPTGISISTDGQVVYVGDYGNRKVLLFSSDGWFLHSLGAQACKLGNIRGVNVDRFGLLYVCDTDNNRVLLY